MSVSPKLTIFDKAIGAVYAPYKSKAIMHRTAQAEYSRMEADGRRAARTGRTDKTGYTNQPYGVYGTRTLDAHSRRTAVRKSREIYENNILGRAMLDRATDNIIGEGMYVKPQTGDEGFDREVSAFWDRYEADHRGMVDNCTLQRRWFRDWKRDGDVGALLLRSGKVQTIESDLIQSPNGGSDQRYKRGPLPEIVDGFKLSPGGKPRSAFIEEVDATGKVVWSEIPYRYMLYIADTDRDDYTAIRGVPELATIGWLLEQIDGTVEATVLAYRMAAMFGLVRKEASPGKTLGNLSLTTSATGESKPGITFEPGMMGVIGQDDDLVQVKPEHPTTSYDQFMTSLVRFAGLNLGLPLELALMDFSKTNYSSARASMEQAYRGFRIQQKRFADCWLSKWYRWRVGKAVKSGEITGTPPPRYLDHKWYGQPWPYLNPVDDAVGTMALIGAGKTTLTEVLSERGMRLDDWIAIQANEMQKASDAGVTLQRSTSTRDAVMDTPAAGAGADLPAVEGIARAQLANTPGEKQSQVDVDQAKQVADAYGVAVRAGVLTPQAEDESALRTWLGLPDPSYAIGESWKLDKGIRRPITLSPPKGSDAAEKEGLADPSPMTNPDETVEL